VSRAALPAALCAAALLVSPLFGQERYVAFGDSITNGLGDDPGGGGYPARMEALLVAAGRDAKVENEGKDGETTAEGLSRITGLTGAAEDTLIIMEGTNDIPEGVSTETTIANLKLMVSRGASRGFGKIFLATILPRGRGATNAERAQWQVLADAIRQAAYDRGWPQPDPHIAFLDAEGYPDALYSDSYHPDADGYELLAAVIGDSVQGIDSAAPAPAFVTPLNGAEGVNANALLEVTLFDPIAGVDTQNSTLTIDDEPIATEVSGDGRRVVLSARPGNLIGRPLLGVDARDLAVPFNRRVFAVSQFIVRGTVFLVGDIDLSGRVDGADMVILARAFGTREGDRRYSAAADLNSNGRVDGTDLALLAANFGDSSF